jgi:endonuclease/exonuclease/phosphatase family metal-dependent hydrolase
VILTRHKILDAQFVEFPVRSRLEARLAGSKQASYADIQVATNLTLRLFAVHTEYRDEATRVRCAETLLAHAKASPFPFVCMGDFNSSPPGFPGAQQDATGVSLMDLLLKSGRFKTVPVGLPTKEQLTFPSWAPERTIDWILVPANWEIGSQAVLVSDLSDHRPVFMRVVPK